MSNITIVSTPPPKLVGASIGERIIVKNLDGHVYYLIYMGYDILGVEGNNVELKTQPLQLFPWTNIINVTKDDIQDDRVVKIR